MEESLFDLVERTEIPFVACVMKSCMLENVMKNEQLFSVLHRKFVNVVIGTNHLGQRFCLSLEHVKGTILDCVEEIFPTDVEEVFNAMFNLSYLLLIQEFGIGNIVCESGERFIYSDNSAHTTEAGKIAISFIREKDGSIVHLLVEMLTNRDLFVFISVKERISLQTFLRSFTPQKTIFRNGMYDRILPAGVSNIEAVCIYDTILTATLFGNEIVRYETFSLDDQILVMGLEKNMMPEFVKELGKKDTTHYQKKINEVESILIYDIYAPKFYGSCDVKIELAEKKRNLNFEHFKPNIPMGKSQSFNETLMIREDLYNFPEHSQTLVTNEKKKQSKMISAIGKLVNNKCTLLSKKRNNTLKPTLATTPGEVQGIQIENTIFEQYVPNRTTTIPASKDEHCRRLNEPALRLRNSEVSASLDVDRTKPPGERSSEFLTTNSTSMQLIQDPVMWSIDSLDSGIDSPDVKNRNVSICSIFESAQEKENEDQRNEEASKLSPSAKPIPPPRKLKPNTLQNMSSLNSASGSTNENYSLKSKTVENTELLYYMSQRQEIDSINEIRQMTTSDYSSVNYESMKKTTPLLYISQQQEIDSLNEVRQMTLNEVVQLLDLLSLGKYIVVFRNLLINGDFLYRIEENSFHEHLGLSKFEARKLHRYIRGWRPNTKDLSAEELEFKDFTSWSVKNVKDELSCINLCNFASFCEGQQVDGKLLSEMFQGSLMASIHESHGVKLSFIEYQKFRLYVTKKLKYKEDDKIKPLT